MITKKIKTIKKRIDTFQLCETPNITLKATYENSKLKDVSFNLVSVHETKKSSSKLNPVYLTSTLFDKHFTDLFYIDRPDSIIVLPKDVLSLIETNKFDLKKLYLANYSSHMLFDLNLKPISLPYSFCYIDSFRQRVPNDALYAKIITKLEKHPFTISIAEGDIPYYNSSFSGQKGISHFVKLSQKAYENLWNMIIEKNGYFPSCELKQAIASSASFYIVDDIYGIKNLLLEWEQIKIIEDRDDE